MSERSAKLEVLMGKRVLRHIVSEELSMLEDAGGKTSLRDPVSERSAMLEGAEEKRACWIQGRKEPKLMRLMKGRVCGIWRGENQLC